MPTKVKPGSPETALARLLEDLEQELLDASDEEILQAAQDLGMNPQLPGSAAFAGLKYPAIPQLSDFFEFEAILNSQTSTTPGMDEKKSKARARKNFNTPIGKKDCGNNH